MFINYSSHPYAQWSAEQKAAAQVYGKVIDLAFPAIDPAADERPHWTPLPRYTPTTSCTLTRTPCSVRASAPLCTG